ncbi:PAS domain-containing hybrid sensor histidine kinase/response regulator [Deefgea piscis]|uniref:PAS domain-containing hybrid sensor histidine kinase/response regulator n=1 Tax=Deefgea piscis TaxID=2739061 RepID=UPI001C80C28A|nr:PAS domain-containing hybrid sensor histidine kinase/response regulator [Deefgea piscis]QZA80057.1 response regulator [Deefgea piscis]
MTLLAQNLLDACTTAILAVTPNDLRIVSANQASALLLGYAQHDLIGRSILEIETGLQEHFFWADVQNGGNAHISQLETDYRHAQGYFLSVCKSVRSTTWEDQTLCVISFYDISQSKRLERESALTASLLFATLESTADGIVVTDLDGHIRHCNAAMMQIWQWSDTHHSEALFEWIKPQLKNAEEFQNWLDLLYSDPYLESQFAAHLHDGRFYDFNSQAQRLGEAPEGRIFSVHDSTAIKTSEAALRIAHQKAQAASHAKSEFLSHMSHELRTPLNAILGFAQLIYIDTDNPQRLLGNYIINAGRHLLDMINEVLDLASIEAGKLTLRHETVDLAPIVRDCCELMQNLASEKNIHLFIDLPLSGCWVEGDARRIKQILLNFTSNAIKYNRPAGSVTLSISQTQSANWRLMVSDTGYGISESDQAQLFMAFSRVGEQQEEIEGTGIGLAFTRKLAQLMQGAVGVKSTLNVGSEFWVDFPAVTPVAAPSSINSGSTEAKQRQILYIEDDQLSQKLMSRIFEQQRAHYVLVLASTAAEGLLLAQQQIPDLILLDRHLPDATGASLLVQLKMDETTRHIPVIALSGDALAEDIHQAIQLGFDAYLTKPLDIAKALPIIDNALGYIHQGI